MERKGDSEEISCGEFKELMLDTLLAKDALEGRLGEVLVLQMFGGVNRSVGSMLLRGAINVAVLNPSLPLRCFLRSFAEKLAMCTLNDLGRGMWDPEELDIADLSISVGGITMLDGISDERSVDLAMRMMRSIGPLRTRGAETALLMMIDTAGLEEFEYSDGRIRGIPTTLLKCFDYIHVDEGESIRSLADSLFKMYSQRDHEEESLDPDIERLEEYVFSSQQSVEPCSSERLLRKVRRAIIHMSNPESGEFHDFCHPGLFGSIVRFSEASARMRGSAEVSDGDVERSIALVKDWLSKLDISSRCGLRGRLRLGEMRREAPSRRIEPGYVLEDVVLPEDVKSDILTAIAEVRSRETIYEAWGAGETLERHSGISVLLTGPPGTGKTMTAEAIARQLGRKLLVVNLAGLTSCYIGETMRNIQRVFEEAKENGDILLFDEADGLFASRTPVFDSVDALVNRDTSFLLSMIENHEGVAILTSNLPVNMDSALERRIDTVIHFPRPTPEEQAEIFGRLMPGGAPADRVDYAKIASKYPLCGGNIVNVVKRLLRTAALRDSLNMDPTIRPWDVERAARAEYRKTCSMGIAAEEVVGYA
ncbi:MAG: AAA family ATPase [Thermoplasmata archaeon]